MRKLFLATVVLAIAAYLALPVPGETQGLPGRIDSAEERIEQKRAREGVLSEDIADYNGRIEELQGSIRGLMQREGRIEVRLDTTRAELAELRRELARVRARLFRLRRELEVAEKALAARLVELYKADEPDALTVVLEADGFADLLERTEFLELVSRQDQKIVVRVRVLRTRARREARRLRALERRAEVAEATLRARRSELVASRGRLVRTRADLQNARDTRTLAFSRLKRSRVRLEGDLAELEAEQARVRAALQAAAAAAAAEQAARADRAAQAARSAQSTGGGGGGGGGGDSGGGGGGGSPAPAPVQRGSGGLIWPVSGPVVSPFGPRWGRLHAGIDIAVPSGTPIRAADSGRVALAGPMGGYGNYLCIQHAGALSTCYAHLSGYSTSQGAAVRQGEVIGSSGCTGSCFGDHLHFETRVGGSPVDPMPYF